MCLCYLRSGDITETEAWKAARGRLFAEGLQGEKKIIDGSEILRVRGLVESFIP